MPITATPTRRCHIRGPGSSGAPGFDGAAHDPSHGQISYALFGRSDQPAGYGSFATGPIPAPLLEQAQAVYGFRIV